MHSYYVFLFMYSRWCYDIIGGALVIVVVSNCSLKFIFDEESRALSIFLKHFEAAHRCCACLLRNSDSLPNIFQRCFTNRLVPMSSVCRLVFRNCVRLSSSRVALLDTLEIREL